jgi:hypothetical protein
LPNIYNIFFGVKQLNCDGVQQIMVWMASFPRRDETNVKFPVQIKKTVQPLLEHVRMPMKLAITDPQLSANEYYVARKNT